jgi:hypothetical protein
MVLPLVSCWWWSCCCCLAENAPTNHCQALQRRAAAGDESVTAWIVGRLCPSLVYHQIIACWLTCWLAAQPTIKVKKRNQLAMGACDEKGVARWGERRRQPLPPKNYDSAQAVGPFATQRQSCRRRATTPTATSNDASSPHHAAGCSRISSCRCIRWGNRSRRGGAAAALKMVIKCWLPHATCRSLL